MKKKTAVYTAAIIGIFMQIAAICISVIAGILAVISNEALYAVFAFAIAASSVYGIWFLLQVWKPKTKAFLSRT